MYLRKRAVYLLSRPQRCLLLLAVIGILGAAAGCGSGSSAPATVSIPNTTATPVPDPTPPTLPLASVDVTMPSTAGYTTKTVCASGCDYSNLQTAINAAYADFTAGWVLTLTAGETFTGPYTFPSRAACSSARWLIVQSSGAIPTTGTNVQPSDARTMPTITATGTNDVITFQSGSCYTRLIGLNVQSANSVNTAGTVAFDAIAIGDASDSTSATQPKFVIVDRCLARAHATGNLRRAVTLQGVSLAVVDSWLVAHEIYTGGDSQGILGTDGPGPFLINHNHIEGSAENIMFGGGLGSNTGNIPSDITITNNRLIKPTSWWPLSGDYAGIHWGVKNLLELKNAQRVLIDSNILEQSWVDLQTGYVFVFTPRATQSGNQTVVNDVTVRWNIARHAASGAVVAGHDDAPDTTLRSQRVLFSNNLWDDINNTAWGNNGDGARPLLATYGVQALNWSHNTILQGGSVSTTIYAVPGGYSYPNFVYQNNLVAAGTYGILCDGDGVGTDCLGGSFSGYSWLTNAVVGDLTGLKFPNVGTQTLNAVAWTNVGFVNYNSGNGGDYRLCTGVNTPAAPCAGASAYHNAGSDGKDIGADAATVYRQTAGVAP